MCGPDPRPLPYQILLPTLLVLLVRSWVLVPVPVPIQSLIFTLCLILVGLSGDLIETPFIKFQKVVPSRYIVRHLPVS